METMIDNVSQGFEELLQYIDWVYMVVFIIITWLFNSFTFSKKKGRKLNRLQKVSPRAWALIIGILLGVFWAWAFDYSSKNEIVTLIFSLLLAMVIYKLGIDRFLGFLNKKTIKTHD